MKQKTKEIIKSIATLIFGLLIVLLTGIRVVVLCLR